MSNAVATEKKSELLDTDEHVIKLREHIVEIVSDSGEGAQKAGQSFGTICAKMGNGIWTEEIIPAEIQPPPRNPAGASGNRIRVGSFRMTNPGDDADLVVAFNEQALLGRVQSGDLKSGCIILLENKWKNHQDPEIIKAYTSTYERLIKDGYKIYEIPMEEECLKYVSNPHRGKNMFALGLLCSIYSRDLQIARDLIGYIFRKKGSAVIDDNINLLNAGYEWAGENLDLKFEIPTSRITEPQIVTDGNVSLALGIMASGMEVCAMYPITPATSASHYLSEIFEKVGGVVHQAEDEIAACGFAVGASYAGKCAVTITSGPGMSLKTELIGLAVMTEIPLVVVNVQRGGPSTGLPTKVEQGDLLAAIFSTHGDAPKVVMAVRSPRLSECRSSFCPMPIWRRGSSRFRGPNSAKNGWRHL
jgi:2-oxoglutarate ferredoxin oxidoreductase subunit alpha